MENDFFGTEKIAKILMKMAPPVMLAQLIQALYNCGGTVSLSAVTLRVV